jgi:hypothetical protein
VGSAGGGRLAEEKSVKRICLLFCFLSACAHQPLPPSQGELLFPDGTYQQNVAVQFQNKNFEFGAVLRKTKEDFSLHAYNSFGITLLTMKSMASGKLEFETSIEEIRKNEIFFQEFFAKIRKMFRWRAGDYQAEKANLEKELNGQVTFQFEKGSGIPRMMVVESPSRYRVEITNQKFSN